MTALVRLQRVRFGGGRRWPDPPALLAVEPLPCNTLDRRYAFCHEHRTACVCREAELAEEIAELRYDLDAARRAALDVLDGHRLYDYGDEDHDEPGADQKRLIRGDGPLACQCSGCRLIRQADLPGLVAHTLPGGVVLQRRVFRRRPT